jgi:cytochrome c-type biogenesis protein CcmF
LAVLTLAGTLVLDARALGHEKPRSGWLRKLAGSRRRYAGFVIHLGFVCLAVGVTGSSLGTRQHEADMREGEVIQWAGYNIRYVGLTQRELPEKFVVAAQLAVSPAGAAPYTLLPAQHLHLPQNEWSTEVAIHSTWARDLYAILHSGKGREQISLTFIENPLMRWLWASGWVAGAGVLLALWPVGRQRRHTVAARSGLAVE